jgi:Cu(I)-responsive transcriptional regulator
MKRFNQLELAQAHQQGLYSIGEASKHSGVSAKMIRHYEALGLIKAAERTQANYRVYNQREVHLLHFIKSARDLGFTLKQISVLVSLWQDQQRASAEVKALALDHIAELDERIAGLQAMRASLAKLAESCKGDQQSDCPILENLAHEPCKH